MITADLRLDGVLENVQEMLCACIPGECMGACAGCLCGCAAAPCAATVCHSDPQPGCKRVVLAAWPENGGYGPWIYDSVTRLAVPNPAASLAGWRASLRVALRERMELADARAVGAPDAAAENANAARVAECVAWVKKWGG